MIVATVERKSWIIQPDKIVTNERTLSDGKFVVELPKPQDYVAGSLYSVRIEQMLKKANELAPAKSFKYSRQDLQHQNQTIRDVTVCLGPKASRLFINVSGAKQSSLSEMYRYH